MTLEHVPSILDSPSSILDSLELGAARQTQWQRLSGTLSDREGAVAER